MKYTSGEAKELIKHCIQQPLSESCKNTLNLLKTRCANPHKILANYKRENRRWPVGKAEDSSSFKLYHNFLQKYQRITSSQSCSVLDLPETLSLIISKCP